MLHTSREGRVPGERVFFNLHEGETGVGIDVVDAMEERQYLSYMFYKA